MHVAVAGWLTAQGPSGARRRLVELLRALAPMLAAGERITLLGGPDDLPELPGVRSLTVPIAIDTTWRRVRDEQLRLPNVLRAERVDVLDLQSLPVPRRLPCPVALTVHDLRDLGPFRRRPAAFARAVLRDSVRRAGCVIVPSAFVAHELRAACPVPRLHVVPGGVAAIEPAHAPRSLTVLHVGHLEPRKNLALLLEAFARARPAPHRLVLAGADAGSGNALRSRAAELGVNDRVDFLGIVTEAELARRYATADVVAIPSAYEGFGLPVLEALAHGRPVLVSDAAALPEVARDAATVLPANDVDAWAAALAGDADHSAEAIAQRRTRARSFSWSVAAAEMLAVWRETASHTPATSIITP